MANLTNFGKIVGHEAQRRSDERRNCRIRCRMSTSSGEFDVTLVNLSMSGAGVETDSINRLRVGDQAHFSSGPLSSVRATVRWASSPRYGLQFQQRPGSESVVEAMFDKLPAS